MNDSLTATPPVEIYDSAARVAPAWRELQQVWQYRSLLALLIANAFRTRYRRSALGIVWILLNPIMSMVVLSIVFSAVFNTRIRAYPVYIMIGYLAWHFFVQTTMGAIQAALSGNGMAKRMYLPRTLYLLASAGESAINFWLGLLPLVGVMLFLNQPLPPTWLLLPFAFVFLFLFVVGVGMWIGTLAVYYADLAHIYELALPMLFFLTPILYPLSVIPEPFRTVLSWNPLWWLILCLRGILSDGQLPPPEIVVGASLVSVLVLIGGWWFYTRRAAEFIYHL